MDSALPHAKLMYAHVLRWSDDFTEVYCPYCNEVHEHEGTKREDVHQGRRPIQRAKCKSPFLTEMGIRYQLKYPFNSYEIDKSNNYQQCLINRDRDVRIPDSKRRASSIPPAPSDCIQSNPYAYNIQGEFPHEVVAPTDVDLLAEAFANLKISSGFPHKVVTPTDVDLLTDAFANLKISSGVPREVVAPTDVDLLTDALANLETSSGSKRPSTQKKDAPHGFESPVIHIREISGLLDEAGHVRGCVGEISICIEWGENSDASLATLQISLISREPNDIRIMFFGTLQPGNVYLGHKIKDTIRKRLKEVRFCLLREPFVSLNSLVSRITPALRAVPVFGNDTYITCLEELLYREQPKPSTLPLSRTLDSPDPLYWRVYRDDRGFVHAGLVHESPFPTTINNWSLENEWKTIAWMWRKGNFPAVYAISGYGSSPLLNEPMPISGADYSLLMIEVLEKLGSCFPPDPNKDRGIMGRFHSCHAEMQFAAYLVYHHRADVGFQTRLRVIAPSGHLESAIIGVSKRPCHVCHSVLQQVCIEHRFRITVEFLENRVLKCWNYPE